MAGFVAEGERIEQNRCNRFQPTQQQGWNTAIDHDEFRGLVGSPAGSAGDLQGFAKESGFLSGGKLFEFNEFGPLPLSKRKNRRYHPRSINTR